MTACVIAVGLCGVPPQVDQAVVCLDTVAMAALEAIRSRPDERFQHQTVHSPRPALPTDAKIDHQVPARVHGRLQKLLCVMATTTVSVRHRALETPHSPLIAGLVEALEPESRRPLFRDVRPEFRRTKYCCTHGFPYP